MDRISERISLFQELISCTFNFYLWEYDKDMNLLKSSCPEERTFEMIFSMMNIKSYLLDYAQKDSMPIVFSNDLDMTWIAVFEKEDGAVMYFHLLGPVFTDEYSLNSKEKALNVRNFSPKLKHTFMNLMESLPTVCLTQFLQYGIMLHCCAAKEKIRNSDFRYYQEKGSVPEKNDGSEEADRAGGRLDYLFEQDIMKMVETGNLDSLNSRNNQLYSGKVGKLSVGDSLRQVKNLCIIHTASCSRAAIRGGLSPETSFTLSDRYIQSCEACKISTEVFQVMKEMVQDYTERVHACRMAESSSPLIKKACDYFDLHIEEGLRMEAIAEYTGYTQNYLGIRFKEEKGLALKDYIHEKKIERSEYLLEFTNLSISEISERLDFCSPSYFAQVFRALVQKTPAEYRRLCAH